jgi:Glycosyltransferases, probably involved in cell wall biogenesis
MINYSKSFGIVNEQDLKFSIVIPAYNEEKLIKRCLDSIFAASAPYKGQVEVIVVLNRCTDRTEEIALSYNCVITKEDSKNMSKIRNAGAKVARGEILITIDADNWITDNMLIEIDKKLMTGKYIGGGVKMKPERLSLGLIAAILAVIPIFAKYGWVSAGLFWCYRKDFEAINGFDENLRMGEDLDFGLRLKKWGRKCGKKYTTISKAHMITSTRKADMHGDWFIFKHPKLLLGIIKGNVEQFADEYFYNIKR